MADSKLIGWIKSQKSQGHSEDQIKQFLINQKYNIKDIDEAISSLNTKNTMPDINSDFNQLILSNGTMFAVLFYAILGIFSLQLIFGIIKALTGQQYIGLIFIVLLVIMLINYIYKRDLHSILMNIFMLSPIGIPTLILIPLVQPFSGTSNITVYILIGIYSLILGLIMAYMFNKTCNTFNKYISTGIIFSSILGLIFAIINIVSMIISTLSANMANLKADTTNDVGGLGFDPSAFFGEAITLNSTTGLIIGLICFNIPYIYFYFQRKDKDYKLFLLYIIPVIVYIAVIFALKELIKILPMMVGI